jgi:hypothetical protein
LAADGHVYRPEVRRSWPVLRSPRQLERREMGPQRRCIPALLTPALPLCGLSCLPGHPKGSLLGSLTPLSSIVCSHSIRKMFSAPQSAVSPPLRTFHDFLVGEKPQNSLVHQPCRTRLCPSPLDHWPPCLYLNPSTCSATGPLLAVLTWNQGINSSQLYRTFSV